MSKLSVSDKQTLYDKTHGKCILCGKIMLKGQQELSLEHYIPRAIYKWIPHKKLKQQLEGFNNLFIVHKQCNFIKDSNLPNTKQIKRLPIDEHTKTLLLSFYKSIENELIQYQAIKQRVLQQQQNQCLFCHKTISLKTSTLRRKNNNQARHQDNAMCLCTKCNFRTFNTQYKHDMVQKTTAVSKQIK